jgi:hypothetical protein
MAINREQWLSQAVDELRPVFDIVGHPLPTNIRVTCGFPSKHARSLNRAIGEHWSNRASSDSTHEILISPVVDDPFEVFGILVHELAHSATDGQGHKGDFPKLVKAMWLDGKPTATVVGARFRDNFAELVESLGEYPHGHLNVKADSKTQSTRMLKAVCTTCIEYHPDTGAFKTQYVIRVSDKWAKKGLPTCVCGTVFTLSK